MAKRHKRRLFTGAVCTSFSTLSVSVEYRLVGPKLVLTMAASLSAESLPLNSSCSSRVWKRGFLGLLFFLSAPSDTV